jgi:uncharacterized protein (DUF983 family)
MLAIIKGKCPRCRKGDLYVKNNPYNLKNLTKMHKTCACCNQNFIPEPGFYYGAMYVSYGLGVMVFAVNFVLFALLYPLPAWAFITINTVILLAAWPLFFRLARTIYLSLFVKYDPEAAKNASC